MLKFSHVNGEAHALVISRSVGMPTTVLRDSILSVQKEADPNARITFEEKRTVNGRQVLATEMSGATEEGVPFRFFEGSRRSRASRQRSRSGRRSESTNARRRPGE